MINNVGRRKTGTLLSSRSGSGIEAPTRAFIKLLEESNYN